MLAYLANAERLGYREVVRAQNVEHCLANSAWAGLACCQVLNIINSPLFTRWSLATLNALFILSIGVTSKPMSPSRLTARFMICVFSVILLDLYLSPDN